MVHAFFIQIAMKVNSFFHCKDLLPVTVKSENNEINYYFEENLERYVLKFLESEMPGVVVGEIDEDIISIMCEKNIFRGFIGEVFSDYFEPIDGDRSIGSIKEIFTATTECELYRKVFKYRNIFSIEIATELSIKTPEEMFYFQFEKRGYKKLSIHESDTHEGYVESNIKLKNQHNQIIEVFYPEYDYSEGYPWIKLDDAIAYNWLDFFDAIENENVMEYGGITRR